ncbi:M1 family metallopeptidase [uncultured Microscilla sp.]|uniref:M1 family metallopeptidase n=1 Tax=uncultured Microscilla sp. TaxID=432653 RepID=UPI002623BCDE|nr:M1 family metallopeptidase [uncultured Microscilla sp.]
MKKLLLLLLSCITVNALAQKKPSTSDQEAPLPKYVSSKFAQLGQELPTPNVYRTGDGSPGPNYWQQKADYKIKATLDEAKNVITGSETITYYNNAPIPLRYLWIQLDQNRFAGDATAQKANPMKLTKSNGSVQRLFRWVSLTKDDYGYTISNVKDKSGKKLKYTINGTMMRLELPQPIKAKGGSFTFSLDWKNKIRERLKIGGRGGYEHFPKDGNNVYAIAQWFPRMCVYDDVNGWQNKQFLGRGEFALTFGDYEVALTVPADHIVGATGELQNAKKVLSSEQIKRWEKAKNAKNPVVIVTQKEAEAKEKTKSTQTKTWIFKAKNVRDFAFTSSRKLIWDAMGVNVGGKNVWAMSYYPKEANPLWGNYSTHIVAHTLKVYSKYTFDYPYPVAISVEASNGMEYPMICFNYGRPNAQGVTSARMRNGMFGVIIHEVGHNFFPMIVNSDERQWTWMDEGLNSFVQTLAEREIQSLSWAPDVYKKNGFPEGSRNPKNIIRYMRIDPKKMVPIMSNSESIPYFGPNAYSKPATALNILRNTIMGPELFDYAFREYSQKWMFKHPKPADFFRTMEDASGVDLDWFWRGWFYSTEPCDISLEGVKLFQVESDKNKTVASKMVFKPTFYTQDQINNITAIVKRRGLTLNKGDKEAMSPNSFFYQLDFKNKGGLLMPIIVKMQYKDGSQQNVKIPAEIWKKDPVKVSKVLMTKKEVVKFVVDPNGETADIDTKNNAFPRAEMSKSGFKKMKEKKGSQE